MAELQENQPPAAAEMPMRARPPAPFGARARWRISAQVALGVLLALAGCVLATWLASRPNLRWRADLTVERRNTLPEELAGIVRQLPAPVEIELFFQRPDGPLLGPSLEAQQRMRELLALATAQFPERLRVVDHDLNDRAAVSNRMRELALEEVDVVVAFRRGREKARSVHKLLRDIARINPGDPRINLPPSLDAFRGEHALALALLKVSNDESLKVVFSTGHGERDPFDTDPRQLGRLETALVSEGFEVARWDPKQEPEVPSDAAVLAVVAPTQLFDKVEIDRIERYIRGGGRCFVAPSYSDKVYDGEGSVSDLLRRFGVEPQAGLVAQFTRSSTGSLVDGIQECATLAVGPEGMDPRHPITESLWRARLVLPISGSRAFRRGSTDSSSVWNDVLRAPAQSWLDMPGANGLHDWSLDSSLEDHSGSFVLSFAGTFGVKDSAASEPSSGAPGAPGTPGTPGTPGASGEPGSPPAAGRAPPQGRLLAFGAAESMSNAVLDYTRDFLLNAFNWLSDREYRVAVRPRERRERVLDVRNTFALARVQQIAGLGLPVALALVGLCLAWRRRR